jgi:uncharacterized protein (DUF1501 family)
MLRFDDAQRVTRRDFLRTGGAAAGALGLSFMDLSALSATPRTAAESCIVLFLVGGPSQLETWDPKPDAPEDVRGPFRAIRTNVPGIHISEHFPRMASMADHYAIVRTVHHEHQAIHETGQQILQTGGLCIGKERPTVGAVVSRTLGAKPGAPAASVILPTPIGNTGVCVSHGQSAGILESRHQPGNFTLSAADLLQNPDREESYGVNTFGQSCSLACRMIEAGVRLVTVNMFDTVYDKITWDCHADGGSLATTFDDYANYLCPMFDQAYTALLEDLQQRGLLEKTLVVAMGEFGRTPVINYRGGRDHWTRCWSVLFAGGGVRGGQVIGRSDAHAAEPLDRPVHASEIAASIYHGFGISSGKSLIGPNGGRVKVVFEASPVQELFA